MSAQPTNPSKGGSLKWAWKLIDRHRNREHIDGNQIETALTAIESVHGRRSIKGSSGYQFENETALRAKHAPK